MVAFFFYLAAVGLIATAAMVVLTKSPLRSALYLIGSLCSLAVLYVLLDASFVAAMQILVYAGAVMVLFVFVIMLLNLRQGTTARPMYLSATKTFGVAATAYLLFVLVRAALGPQAMSVKINGAGSDLGSVLAIGKLLLSQYLFHFEAISLLLLVAIVGAVVLGLRKLT